MPYFVQINLHKHTFLVGHQLALKGGDSSEPNESPGSATTMHANLLVVWLKVSVLFIYSTRSSNIDLDRCREWNRTTLTCFK